MSSVRGTLIDRVPFPWPFVFLYQTLWAFLSQVLFVKSFVYVIRAVNSCSHHRHHRDHYHHYDHISLIIAPKFGGFLLRIDSIVMTIYPFRQRGSLFNCITAETYTKTKIPFNSALLKNKLFQFQETLLDFSNHWELPCWCLLLSDIDTKYVQTSVKFCDVEELYLRCSYCSFQQMAFKLGSFTN